MADKKNPPPRPLTVEDLSVLRYFHIYLAGVESAQDVIDEWSLYDPAPDPNDYSL